jgi:hypothetical protein
LAEVSVTAPGSAGLLCQASPGKCGLTLSRGERVGRGPDALHRDAGRVRGPFHDHVTPHPARYARHPLPKGEGPACYICYGAPENGKSESR